MNTDDTALMKYEKKFMQKAVSIMYTMFSFKKEHGRCFHPKSLLRRSKSRSLAPRLLYVSITFFSSLSQSLVMMQRRCTYILRIGAAIGTEDAYVQAV